MIDLTTEYLGLSLKNPLIASAFPRNAELAFAQTLESAGVGAIVLPSLFEEAIIHEQQTMSRFVYEQETGFPESANFLPQAHDFEHTLDKYLDSIRQLKEHLSIPVIASLNGDTNEGWLDYAKELELAGADALELNIYHIAADGSEPARDVEQRYCEIVARITAEVDIPVAIKIGSQFSSPAHFALQLQQSGAAGIVIFNRFYLPDIDIDNREVVPDIQLSQPWESLLRIRWAAILSHQLSIPVSVTGGFHQYQDTAKAILVGAQTIQLCSAIIRQGPYAIETILKHLRLWMNQHEYASLNQIRGSMSQKNAADPSAYERANYVKVMDSYQAADGVWR